MVYWTAILQMDRCARLIHSDGKAVTCPSEHLQVTSHTSSQMIAVSRSINPLLKSIMTLISTLNVLSLICRHRQGGGSFSVIGGSDCEDYAEFVHPDATEYCDGIHNNCSSLTYSPTGQR